MRSRWRALVTLTIASPFIGCSTGAVPSMGAPSPAATSYSLLTADEIAHQAPNEMLLSALQHLRPTFLGSARSTPMVFMDGIQVLQVSDLATVFASSVADVRLVRGSLASAAIATSGVVVVGDAILIRTRRR